MVAWRHFGALLARPIGRFLVRHGLHKKISVSFNLSFSSLFALSSFLIIFLSLSYMLCQTTDSGSNNGPMATEMQSMFSNAEDPTFWQASAHHVRCYAHKLNLTVGHGLKAIGKKVSVAKPCVPLNHPLPIPTFEVNDGDDNVEIDNDESDDEDDTGLPDKPDGVDEVETNEELVISGVACEEDDIVANALSKVSPSLSSSYHLSS